MGEFSKVGNHEHRPNFILRRCVHLDIQSQILWQRFYIFTKKYRWRFFYFQWSSNRWFSSVLFTILFTLVVQGLCLGAIYLSDKRSISKVCFHMNTHFTRSENYSDLVSENYSGQIRKLRLKKFSGFDLNYNHSQSELKGKKNIQ